MKEEILKYAEAIQKAYHADPFWGGENGEHTKEHSFSVEFGKKYAKVNHKSWGSTSVHCFIEIANGNIHKAATFKAPQKNGLRGNIMNEKRPLFGADYYVR